MSIPQELEQLHRDFWKANNLKFDMSTNEGCGLYTEAFVKHARSKDAKIGHLRKSGGQTQYNGHANDAFLYAAPFSDTNFLFQAVDLIGNAEQPKPWKPAPDGNDPPTVSWGVDTPRYTINDWLAEPANGIVKTVPWVNYDENGFQRLKRVLEHDYARRPQGADFDVSIWSARYFHNCYMGPDGTPLGEEGALKRIKPELCGALGLPNDNYLG